MTDTPSEDPQLEPAGPAGDGGRQFDIWLVLPVILLVLSLAVDPLTPSTFLGLPTHAIVVHAAVVFIPLFAIAAIVLMWVEKWRLRFTPWLAGGSILLFAITTSATSSGEKLRETVGRGNDYVERHQEWADRLHWIVLVLAVVLVAHFIVKRLVKVENKGITLAFKIVSTVVAAATLISVAIVGHLGAEAVWKDRVGGAPSLNGPQNGQFPSFPGGSTGSGSVTRQQRQQESQQRLQQLQQNNSSSISQTNGNI